MIYVACRLGDVRVPLCADDEDDRENDGEQAYLFDSAVSYLAPTTQTRLHHRLQPAYYYTDQQDRGNHRELHIGNASCCLPFYKNFGETRSALPRAYCTPKPY